VELSRGAAHLVLAAVVIAIHVVAAMLAYGEPAAFPPSVVTREDRIAWLTAEADVAAQAVDAEAEEPLPQQREALYRAMRARGVDLMRLSETIGGRLPRLEARVNETMTKANAALDRIANRGLQIGMSTEQVRQIRGEPSRTSQITTTSGLREQWHYGMTVLSFDDGKLVRILLMLTGE